MSSTSASSVISSTSALGSTPVAAQSRLDVKAVESAAVHRGVEPLGARFPAGFRSVHRDLASAKYFFYSLVRGGDPPDANARRRVNPVSGNRKAADEVGLNLL